MKFEWRRFRNKNKTELLSVFVPFLVLHNAAQQRHQPDLTTALFNEGVLLAKSLFIVALCACPSSGLCRGVRHLFEVIINLRIWIMPVLSKKRKFCAHCMRNVEAEKRITTVSLILLTLGLCSFGFLLPVWILYEMVFLQIFREDEVMSVYYYQCPRCKQVTILNEKKGIFG